MVFKATFNNISVISLRKMDICLGYIQDKYIYYMTSDNVFSDG